MVHTNGRELIDAMRKSPGARREALLVTFASDDTSEQPSPASPGRRGRKPLPEARRCAVVIKVSARERGRIAMIARMNQQSMSEFIRDAVAAAAAECSDALVLRTRRYVTIPGRPDAVNGSAP